MDIKLIQVEHRFSEISNQENRRTINEKNECEKERFMYYNVSNNNTWYCNNNMGKI